MEEGDVTREWPGAGEEAARIREQWARPPGGGNGRAVPPHLLVEVAGLVGLLERPGVAEKVLSCLDEEVAETNGPADRLRDTAAALGMATLANLPDDYGVLSF